MLQLAEFEKRVVLPEDFDMESMTDFIETRDKAKRKEIPAATLREKQGDAHLSRDVPKEQRKSDEELLCIGLRSTNEGNKRRWREAPYVWNAREFLYEEYYYLIDKRGKKGEYVWDDDLLWKFARYHNMSVFPSRQPLQALLKSEDIRGITLPRCGQVNLIQLQIPCRRLFASSMHMSVQ